MEILLIILALLAGFLLRVQFMCSPATDEGVSFWHILRHKGKKWVTYDAHNSVVDGIYGYPVLQHFLISRVPEKYWGHFGRVLNILYDIVTALIVYGIACMVNPNEATTLGGLSIPLVSMIVYLFYPALLPSMARMKTIKARSMGSFLVALYFVSMMGGFFVSPYYFVASIVLGLTILLSSLFGMQVMVFFSIVMSIYLKSFIPAGIILIVGLIAYCIPQLKAWTPVVFWWEHIVWYRRNYEKGTTASDVNKWQDLLLYPVYLFTNPKKFLALSSAKLTPIAAIRSAPAIILLVILCLLDREMHTFITSMPAWNFMWGIVIASIVMFIISSISIFKIIGEAERYFEYSAPFASIMFCVGVVMHQHFDMLLWGLLLFQLCSISLNFVRANYTSLFQTKRTDEALNEMVTYMRTKLKKGVVLTMPIKLSFTLATELHSSKIKHYFRFLLKEGEKGMRYFEDDAGGWTHSTVFGWHKSIDVFSLTPQQMKKKYKADYLLVKKDLVKGITKTWGTKEAKRLKKPLKQNSKYLLLSLKK